MADEGYGQQSPQNAAPFNSDVFIIAQQIAKLSTLKIVLVKAVDTAAKTVDVQPMVNQVDGNGGSTPHGTILGIPYQNWQFGKNAVLADPVVDDIGIMVCADRDISAVKAAKAIANPGSERKMDAADGVYLGGILNADPEQWIKFTETGMEWHDKNSNVLTSGPSGWEFTGPVKFNQLSTFMLGVDVTGSAIMRNGMQLGAPGIVNIGGAIYTGNITTSGEITAGTIGLKTHHHTAQGATAPTTAAQT